MFAAPSHTTNASTDAMELSTWFPDNDSLLLSPQDVLNYTPFTHDSHPSLFAMEPSLDAFSFPEFAAPLATADQMFQDMSSPVLQQPMATTMDCETARNAALLRAYIEQQQQQQPWMFPTVPDAAAQQAQKKRLEQEQEEKRRAEQQSDADNLARYFAQQIQQQIKRESSVETAMDHDTVSAPQSPFPSSSSSSEADDKSPMGSPTLMERSLSPETSSGSNVTKNAAAAAASSKISRQLVCFNCKVTQTPLWRRTPDRQHSLCNACGLYYKQYGAHRPLNVRHKLPTVLADVRLNSLPYARPSAQVSRASSPTPSSSAETPYTLASPILSVSSDSDSDSARSQGVNSLPDLAKLYAEAMIPPPTKKITPPLMTAKQGIQCFNCSQTQTPLWRKNDAGDPICNACGLYAKLHNRDRPVTMRKTKITRRRRDWGGNLAHRAYVEAQAMAIVHAQARTTKAPIGDQQGSVFDLMEEMNLRARELTGHPSSLSVPSSDSEEEQPLAQPNQSIESVPNTTTTTTTAPLTPPSAPPGIAQSLSNNMILDENRFADVVGQMNAHQMNKFLSILETRCGVLRQRLLASTEATAQQQSSFDSLF
ncbi:putative electron transfer flavoprotein subunit [Dissophora ornata]|nr:putative electron transfer flavoprotein subunit [Dissophora ornata]